MIVVTHEMAFARDVSNRMAFFKNGRHQDETIRPARSIRAGLICLLEPGMAAPPQVRAAQAFAMRSRASRSSASDVA